MRQSFKFEWLKHNEEVIGLNLGADYCAEHEWGISSILLYFGINPGVGLESRIMTKLPNERLTVIDDVKKKKTGKTVLTFNDYSALSDPTKVPDIFKMRNVKGEFNRLQTAWDEKSFGICAHSPEDRENLRKLIEAFKVNDVAIWLGGGGVFQNAGLVMVIASKVPSESKAVMKEVDEDVLALKNADLATGIKEELKTAGKGYYALSPKWANEIKSTKDGEIKTEFNVIYWLNPMNQSEYNYGWFTVEQLKQWAKNEGPCIKQKEEIKIS